MAVAGRPLDEELMEHILTGVDADFNPAVSVLLAQRGMATIDETYSQLLAFETRMDLLGVGNSGSSANAANQGGHGGYDSHCHGGFNRGHGNNSNTGLGRGAPMP